MVEDACQDETWYFGVFKGIQGGIWQLHPGMVKMEMKVACGSSG
jgi:hypothetical protein